MITGNNGISAAIPQFESESDERLKLNNTTIQNIDTDCLESLSRNNRPPYSVGIANLRQFYQDQDLNASSRNEDSDDNSVRETSAIDARELLRHSEASRNQFLTSIYRGPRIRDTVEVCRNTVDPTYDDYGVASENGVTQPFITTGKSMDDDSYSNDEILQNDLTPEEQKQYYKNYKKALGHDVSGKLQAAIELENMHEYSGFGVPSYAHIDDNSKRKIMTFVRKNDVAASERYELEQQIASKNKSALEERMCQFKSKIIDPLSRLLKDEEKEETKKKSDENALTFLHSETLCEFLDKQQQENGKQLLWEQESSSNATSQESVEQNGENAKKTETHRIHPSIVYNGMTIEPPIYAGELASRSFVLHACEIHQLVPAPNVELPEFLGKSNPYIDSLNSLLPLPFDPQNTGMPALTHAMVKAGLSQVQVAPIMATYFDHEIQVNDPALVTRTS